MAKKKAVTAEGNTLTIDNVESLSASKRNFDIREASIKEEFCNYSFEVTSGTGSGDVHKVTGTGMVKDSLNDAFAKLNVHLAVIDEVFKAKGIEVEDIDNYHNDETTFNYRVSSFKIKGSGDNESVMLTGQKFLSISGRMDIKTPFIPIDGLSHYKWYNELNTAINHLREEVALYKEGNYIHQEETFDDENQMTIDDVNFEEAAV